MSFDSDEMPPAPRPALRSYGFAPGRLPPGPDNSMTDVPGVMVGHETLWSDQDIRTGVTAILPHPGNLYQEKVPAGLVVGNGFGKLAGATQLSELGEIETPVLLTNTLAVAAASQSVMSWTLAQPGNQAVISVNPVVGETNDGYLNDIRRLAISPERALQAILHAKSAPPAMGVVGAGTGLTAFGWKAGIGCSSRVAIVKERQFSLGCLVQANFGGDLFILGVPVGGSLQPPSLPAPVSDPRDPGSILIIIATDAPLSDRNLARLARRALFGLARTGASFANGSGDYAIAFSTAESVRRTPRRRSRLSRIEELPNDLLNPLFLAAAEATEEAILNALFTAQTVKGYLSRTSQALPLQETLALLRAAGSHNQK